MFDMCQFGMMAEKEGEVMPVQKTTRVASNSGEVLKRLRDKCPNRGGQGERHEHVHLEGRLTKSAQVCPRNFCETICEGIAAEKRLRALGLEALSLDEISAIVEEMKGDGRYGGNPYEDLHECESEEEGIIAKDDLSGEPLEPEKVRSARRKGILYFRGMKVYVKVPKSECFENTGKAPIGVRW